MGRIERPRPEPVEGPSQAESGRLPGIEGYVRGILAGDRRSIARAISQVERQRTSRVRESQARALLTALYPYTGRAHIVGVTGAPGTGKSTLVNQIARTYRQDHNVPVGIIAVDPTSPYSGGALLGDRIRMRDVAGDPGIFIRSMATRGALGGLSRSTFEAAQILDAAGYSVILVETVGAGQDEVEIAHTAHTTIVVEAPGLGDDIQAIKAGIIEIADIFVVNKADRDGAEATICALELVLQSGYESRLAASSRAHKDRVLSAHSGRPHSGASSGRTVPAGCPASKEWQVPICRTVALDGTGTTDLVSWIDAHRAFLEASGHRRSKELARARSSLEGLLHEALFARFVERLEPGALQDAISRIASRQLAPYEALEHLLADQVP
jgi:LAO/AO transport system kinase